MPENPVTSDPPGTAGGGTTEPRQLRMPWRIVELDGAYRIEDAAGFLISYVYMTRDPEQRRITKRMAPEQALRIAQAIVALPEMRTHLHRTEVQIAEITGSRPTEGET